jgi:hypothetical protein
MTTPKEKPKAKADASTEALPSHAHARAGESDAPTLTDAEVSAANAAYQVRFIRYDKLAPYARNHQVHDEAQVAAIAASIEAFGFVGAVIADHDGILAGHGRVLAAEKLYKAGKRIKAPNGARIPNQTVPWIDVTGLSAGQRRAYIIADNQLTRRAKQDFDILRLEISDLQALDFDVGLLGFEPGAIDAMFKTEAGSAPDGDADPVIDEPEAPTIIACPNCQHQFSVLKEVDAKKGKRKKAA